MLVLGGGSEIALAIVRELVRKRASTVLLAGRDPLELERHATGLREVGAGSVEVLSFDADETGGHSAFVEQVFSRDGDIDLVLVAFGVLGGREPRDREKALAAATTNYVGGVSVLLPIADRLEAQGHGTIVVLSSVAAERPRRANFHYGASKAGLDAFAQGLGDALAGTGVQVMVVRPGFVRTRMTAGLKAAPLATTPEGVAMAAIDGLRRGAHTVWAPPSLRWLMCALRLVPRSLFRRLPD